MRTVTGFYGLFLLLVWIGSSVGCGGGEVLVGDTGDPKDAALVDATGETGMDVDDPEPGPVPGIEPPPPPTKTLGYEPPDRVPDGVPPAPAEIEAFTRRVMSFFADTGYFDWVFRVTHGLDATYDPAMMDYRLWWQGTHMRRDGDTITFTHHRYAENIAKRTAKVLINAAAGHLLTGDERMAEVAAHLMRGMVALSLGMEFADEDPPVKYLQARAVWTHNHEYEVDGRRVAMDYEPTHVVGGKWNVHSYEITDNPTYGSVWVSNMRSKDDVPYMFYALNMVTRVYYETQNAELKEAARLFIEYMRGFAQSIVDNDWYILTKYADGEATIALDTTKTPPPAADLGSFVHWEVILGPDAECTAQLGAALVGYGYTAGKGDCAGGMAGLELEKLAGITHFFNYNIYNFFHIAALAAAQLWGHHGLAESLTHGLVERFDTFLWKDDVPNSDNSQYPSDSAGWLLAAATQGYPLTAHEARHIMQWWGDSADWYRQWEHWDPWSSLPEGEDFTDYKPPRSRTVPDGEGGETQISYVRLVEMPYIFEYCYSPMKASNGVPFIDCAIVADPTQWK